MRRRLLLAALLAWASTASTQDASTIYRCTGAGGEVTIQNGTPCPAGSRQEVRRLEALPTLPAPPALVAPPLVEAQPRTPPPLSDFEQVAGPQDPVAGPPRPDLPPPARIASDSRLPPPPIYQCETWDNDGYVSEDPAPGPRCVRLDTAGVGQACENRYDTCARVGQKAECEAWKRRQREIESSWRHAPAQDRFRLQGEFARVTRILTDSTCALPP